MKNFIERLEDLKFTAKGIYANGYNSALDKAKELFNELHPSTDIPAPEPEKQAKEGSFKVGQTIYAKNPCVMTDGTQSLIVGKGYTINHIFNGHIVVKSETSDIHNFSIENTEKFFTIQPETSTIPFDYQRWKSGDYLRVVTRNWRDVEQLVEFKCDDEFRLYGVIDNSVEVWRLDGRYKNSFDEYAKDLHLEIATPKPKQVTTYHWVDSTGYVRGSQTKEIVRKITTPVIGETITEQQPDGSFKIISTTLK